MTGQSRRVIMKHKPIRERKSAMEFALYTRFGTLVRQLGAEGAAKYAVSLGFSAVEAATSAHAMEDCVPASMEEAHSLREVFARHGLRTVCYSSSADLLGEEAPRWEQRLCEHARRAAAMGSPYLHHTLIPWLRLPENAPSYEEALTRVLEPAVRIAQYAGTLGVRCLYEPQGMYFNGARGFGDFYRTIRARTDNVGICADTGNPMFADDTVLPLLTEFGGEIRHVHIKDYRREAQPSAGDRRGYRSRGGAYLRETVIGEGDVDFDAVLRLLHEAGYRGAFSFENSHPEPYEDGVRAGMKLLNELAAKENIQ